MEPAEAFEGFNSERRLQMSEAPVAGFIIHGIKKHYYILSGGRISQSAFSSKVWNFSFVLRV